MSDVNHILPENSGNRKPDKLSDERLMAYLEGKLPPGEQHEVEQWLSEEGMESDAIEGLNAISPVETRQMVGKLNRSLHKTLKAKKKRRQPLNTGMYTIIAIIIILLLSAVAYFVIRMM
jgi:hypothetical protein